MSNLHPDQFHRSDEARQMFRPTYESKHGSVNVTPSGYIYNLGIRPKQQGKGHGTVLMGQVISDADRLGRPLSLHAREELHPFYQRLGFERDTSPTAHVDEKVFGGPLLKRSPRRKNPPV